MAEQFVSKFDIGGETIEVKDASARTTAATETISITTGTHDVT